MSNTEHSMFNSPKAAIRYAAAEAITGGFARDLLDQTGLLTPVTKSVKPSLPTAISTPLTILDNACGTGVVTSIIYDNLTEAQRNGMHVVCGDSSESMIAFVQSRITTKGWKGVEAKIVNAMKSELADESFTHVVTNFGIMLMPDPSAALDECFRMLRPTGICAFTTWLAPGWFPDIRAAFATIPDSPPFPTIEAIGASLNSGSWHEVAYVEEQLRRHGFTDIRVEVSRKTLTSHDAASFCELFDPMLMHLVNTMWTEEERQRSEGKVKEGVKRYLESKYGKDKEIAMDWVAILATGKKPG